MQEAVRKLTYLIFLRAVLVTVLLGSYYLPKIGFSTIAQPVVFSYFVILLYLLTAIYILFLRQIKNISQYIIFAYTQIVIDILAETILLYLTGGLASWFSFLFPVSIISAAIMLNRRACYAAATLSSCMYGLLITLQFAGILPVTTDIVFMEKDYFYNIFSHITIFYLVAFLSGYHSEKLYRTTRSLEEKNTILSDLKVFSRDIIESMTSGVFTTDLNWKIVTFNTSAQKILKCSFDSVEGKDTSEIFPFLGGSKRVSLERIEGTVIVDGRSVPVGMGISALKDSLGKQIGIIGVFQDLTEFKAMEAEVKKKEKWAFIGELSASIAHELRNPLASLKASIDMLREKKVSSEYADHLMQIALSEMDRLNAIITDFLLYAKPQEPNKTSFDLHQYLSDVATLLRSSETGKKNVTISEDIEGQMLITGDPKQLLQVFWNLGINALDAVTDGGNISISTRKTSSTVEILFKDTGTGINQENIDKIFYPFFTTKDNGTGLGLAITQKIVEAHGGRIMVKSKSDGTTFRVMLPANN
ncbi:MAG: PAS domain S-box protein [Nitrospirae bacterium]|nr:PAS domain S-box protein [Nitrospirota bacterium]